MAAQRFLLKEINTYFCLIPLFLYIIHVINKAYGDALGCLILTIFISPDNGGGVYLETDSWLRYIIYILAFISILYSIEIKFKLKILFGISIMWMLITLTSIMSWIEAKPLDDNILIKNLMVLLLITIVATKNKNEIVNLSANLKIIYVGVLGYLFGELINGLYFYDKFPDYMSYDSTKAFIIFPFIYSIIKEKSRLKQFLLLMATSFVIFLYGTRMITLSFFGLLFIAIIIQIAKEFNSKKLLIMFGLISIILMVNWVEVLGDELVLFKALSFISLIQENFDLSDVTNVLLILDPVRYGEHILFFDRSIFEIFFGSGLGSGLTDSKGVLNFVTADQTAFSDKELSTSIYYNLHDFWISYGLRFGLIPVLVIVYIVSFKNMLIQKSWHGVLFGVLIINTTFSTSGLLITALLIRFFPKEISK